MDSDWSAELWGSAHWRGQEEYEEIRRAIVWNERKPDRFPEVIVKAHDVQDVISTVRWAHRNGRRVSARSGGHSWSGSSVRDGGVLVDLANLRDITIDPDRRLARVGPAVRAREFDLELRKHKLIFPVGHCPTVGLGGFLLGGGYGWQMRQLGQACLSIRGIELVNADGEVLWADEHTNADFFWAARGSGPGFFGVITRFELALYPRPKFTRVTTYTFPRAIRDDVLCWAWETHDRLSTSVEFVVVARSLPPEDPSNGKWTPVIEVIGIVFADDDEEATRELAPIEECALRDQALAYQSAVPATMDDFYEMNDRDINPPGFRYAADNMWSNAGPDELLPELAELYDTVPTDRTLIAWWRWGDRALPDAALSTSGDVWLGCYAIYEDEADDARCQTWVTEQMRRLQPLSVGIQLSDENLAHRFYRPLSDRNLARLEELRARHDPDRVFESFLRPKDNPTGGSEWSRTR